MEECEYCGGCCFNSCLRDVTCLVHNCVHEKIINQNNLENKENDINEVTEKIIPKQEINDNNNIEIKKDDNDNKDNNKESNINLSLIKDKKEGAEAPSL